MSIENCMLGARNEQRIIALEKTMEKTQTMIFWLTTSSFALLTGMIVALVMMLIRQHA